MAGGPPEGLPEYIVEFSAGTRIFKEGDLGAEMYIIESGEVEIYVGSSPREGALAVLSAGDFFGEMALLEGAPRYASARARTDCRILAIDATTFDQILHDDAEIAVRMLRKLAHRLRQVPIEVRGPEIPPVAPVPESSAVLPIVSRAVGRAASLRHPEGSEFPLQGDKETIIGRLDPSTGLRPEIDLEGLNPDRSVSRLHAKIVGQGQQFFLVEEIGAANGTFVNGTKLQKGTPHPLEDGDRLGFGTVELTFRQS